MDKLTQGVITFAALSTSMSPSLVILSEAKNLILSLRLAVNEVNLVNSAKNLALVCPYID